MAVVVNSDASAFKRTANLPDDISFSMWGWFYFGTDRNTFTGLLALVNSSGGSPTSGIQLATDSDGTSLKLFTFVPGSNADSATIVTLSAGTWYFGAITCSGTAAGNTIAYVRALTANSLTSTNVDRPDTAWTPGAAEWGRDGFTGDYLNGRIHACGMADVALSANELLELSYYHEPQLDGIRSLNVFYPTIESVNTNASIDRSGNGRNATATVGALADAPALLWRTPGPQIILPAASGGALSLDIDTAGAITLAGQSVTAKIGVDLATQGAIAVAGQSVTPALTIPVGAGAIAVAGQAATFGIGVAQSVAGAIALAGQAVTPALTIPVTAGAVALAGQSATLDIGSALANGAVTLAGQSVTLANGANLSVDIDTAGAITFAGESVTLVNATNITVDIDAAGQITLAGQLVDAALSGQSQEVVTGGGVSYAWQNWYDLELQRRRQRKRELEEAREEVEKLEDRVEREIGQILQQQERRDEKRADLERLRGMLDEFPKTGETMSARTFEALERARIRGTLSALAQLDRELKQMEEELETALIMVMINA